MKKVTNDPEKYRRMSVPYKSEEEAREMLTAFLGELGEIREKYKVPNVVLVTKASVMIEGQEKVFPAIANWGDSAHVLSMLAWAFGDEQKKLLASAGIVESGVAP